MKYDLVIYNAKIVTEEEVFLGYICVSDGKIAAMGSDAPVYEAAQSLDAKRDAAASGSNRYSSAFF